MTGTWLGQQPLGHQSNRRHWSRSQRLPRLVNFPAVALGCLLLVGGGCVDVAARTAGLPIAGQKAADESPAATNEKVAEDEPTKTVTLPPDPRRPSFATSPTGSASSQSVAASAKSGSADGFPDASEVGLGH